MSATLVEPGWRNKSALPGFGLSLGFTLLYLSNALAPNARVSLAG